MAQDRKIQFATQVIPKIEAQQAATAGSLVNIIKHIRVLIKRLAGMDISM